jgi:CRP-like cAMP-binding protein
LRGKVGVLIPEKHKKNDPAANKGAMLEVNELGVGETFGELALIENKPRKATIICKENCDFATLDRASYSELLEEADRIRIN